MSVRRLVLVFALCLQASVSGASQPQPLDAVREIELIEFAAEHTGIDVWYVLTAIVVPAQPVQGTAIVIFEPSGTAEACMAPAVVFSGQMDEAGNLEWQAPEAGALTYRVWFVACDDAERGDAVFLEDVIGFDTLGTIRSESDSILAEALARIGGDREGLRREARIREIGLRYDSQRGPVYSVRFEGSLCVWVSADVTFEEGRSRVLDARLAMC